MKLEDIVTKHPFSQVIRIPINSFVDSVNVNLILTPCDDYYDNADVEPAPEYNVPVKIDLEKLKQSESHLIEKFDAKNAWSRDLCYFALIGNLNVPFPGYPDHEIGEDTNILSIMIFDPMATMAMEGDMVRLAKMKNYEYELKCPKCNYKE